jgi:hypothetical protein
MITGEWIREKIYEITGNTKIILSQLQEKQLATEINKEIESQYPCEYLGCCKQL